MSGDEKTLIRTVRISKALDTLLRKDAKTKRITVNALISSIMTKYAEWDRYNERFGVITMKREAFKSILGVIEDDNITRVQKKLVFRYLSNSYCFGLRKLIYRHIWNICP